VSSKKLFFTNPLTREESFNFYDAESCFHLEREDEDKPHTQHRLDFFSTATALLERMKRVGGIYQLSVLFAV
jgi:hypothetical protein